MELTIVEKDGVKKFDTTAAEANVEKYSRWRRVLAKSCRRRKEGEELWTLREILELAEFELKNAEEVLRIMNELSHSWELVGSSIYQGNFSFLCEYRRGSEKTFYPAVAQELFGPISHLVGKPYSIIPLDDAHKVLCPGCPKMRHLILRLLVRMNGGFRREELIVCGNSVHKIPPL